MLKIQTELKYTSSKAAKPKDETLTGTLVITKFKRTLKLQDILFLTNTGDVKTLLETLDAIDLEQNPY